MVVTGTQQRVYGTLTGGGCIIDLHRFALVSGSTTQSPTEASTVTYADVTPYRQCGYKYAGYLTLFLSILGSSVYAAVEVRICKNDAKRIVIETYGEVAKTITGGMSLWFNKGTDADPDWVKLNSTTSGVKMPYATISYTFKESKRNGSTTIDCCKKCPTCKCMICSINDPLYAITTYRCRIYFQICIPGYGCHGWYEYLTKYSLYSITWTNPGGTSYTLQTYTTPDNYPDQPIWDSSGSFVSMTKLNPFVYEYEAVLNGVAATAEATLECDNISWDTEIGYDVNNTEIPFNYLKDCNITGTVLCNNTVRFISTITSDCQITSGSVLKLYDTYTMQYFLAEVDTISGTDIKFKTPSISYINGTTNIETKPKLVVSNDFYLEYIARPNLDGLMGYRRILTNLDKRLGLIYISGVKKYRFKVSYTYRVTLEQSVDGVTWQPYSTLSGDTVSLFSCTGASSPPIDGGVLSGTTSFGVNTQESTFIALGYGFNLSSPNYTYYHKITFAASNIHISECNTIINTGDDFLFANADVSTSILIVDIIS